METLNHLFFECSFVSTIWDGVAGGCGISGGDGPWNEDRSYLLAHCTTNSGYQRCMIVVLIYYIWKERNHRRMQGQHTTVDSLIRQCKVALVWCGQQDKKIARFFA